MRLLTKWVTGSFVWLDTNKDIRKWAKRYLVNAPQSTVTPPGIFYLCDDRFKQVHLDLVGPLPSFNGFVYTFTCIARSIRRLHFYIMGALHESAEQTLVEAWKGKIYPEARGRFHDYYRLSGLSSR